MARGKKAGIVPAPSPPVPGAEFEEYIHKVLKQVMIRLTQMNAD